MDEDQQKIIDMIDLCVLINSQRNTLTGANIKKFEYKSLLNISVFTLLQGFLRYFISTFIYYKFYAPSMTLLIRPSNPSPVM